MIKAKQNQLLSHVFDQKEKFLEFLTFLSYAKAYSFFYAPNFEEVDGANWFRVVHECVHPSVRQVRARVLIHIWIPNGKVVDARFFFFFFFFFFLIRVISLSGVMSL